ncbi:MAG TPA: plasmid pRiA4b ORF-3 family protein, partial [Longimicrobiales bacterium]
PVWRRVLVPEEITLHGLHRIVQILMQWYDYHLYDFEIRGERYEAPDHEAEGADSTQVSLADLGFQPGERFTYRCDFGDNWKHEVVVEERTARQRNQWLPWVLEGERAAPPEDCGGVSASAGFFEARSDPMHEEHQQLIDWAGEDYDPNRFDRRFVNHSVIMAWAWGALEGG